MITRVISPTFAYEIRKGDVVSIGATEYRVMKVCGLTFTFHRQSDLNFERALEWLAFAAGFLYAYIGTWHLVSGSF